eukprot:6429365-Pyramimonas_sp.AAC.1
MAQTSYPHNLGTTSFRHVLQDSGRMSYRDPLPQHLSKFVGGDEEGRVGAAEVIYNGMRRRHCPSYVVQ